MYSHLGRPSYWLCMYVCMLYVCIHVGSNDPRVKKAESDQMVEAIRKNGLDVTYVVYPGKQQKQGHHPHS